MNSNTNMLYRSKESAEKLGELFKELTPIPDHLQNAANRKLNGADSAQVSFKSGGLLSRFAEKLRRRKAEKESQKSNL